MNNQSVENIEDEISLIEIIDFFRENLKTIVLGGIVGGIIGVSAASIEPSFYQATASIQSAKVANSDVEAPNILLEKLKMPMYYSSETFINCGVDKLAEPGMAIVNGIKPTLAKNAPIITISYKDRNSDDAKKCLESVLNDVRNNQNQIAQPMLVQKNNQVSNLKQKLESAEKISKMLSTKNPNFDFSDSKFSAATLLLATTLSKLNEGQDLRTQINDLELALAEPQTKEAFLTTPIYAPNVRIEPKISLLALVSVIGGMVLVIGVLMVRRVWAKIKIRKEAL